MLKYVELKANPNAVLALTGLSEAAFEQFVPYFGKTYRLWQQKWTSIGQQRMVQHTVKSVDNFVMLEDRLLFILMYVRKLPTQENICHRFSMPQPTVSLWIRSLLPVLRNTLIDLQSSPMYDHNVLCSRLTQNPAVAALLQCESKTDERGQVNNCSLFGVASTSSEVAPFIHVHRKRSQLLVHSRQADNERISLTVGELFSGAGGFGLGFMLADHPFIRYRPLFAIDNDESSLATYQKNTTWLAQYAPKVLDHEPSAFVRDVRKLSIPAIHRWLQRKNEQDNLDLLIGGPPCQGFSTSNRTNKHTSKLENNALVNVFLDAVQAFRPKMFLMENVQGVRWTAPSDDMTIPREDDSVSDVQQFKTVRDFLRAKARALGYSIWDDILDAADYGVPQHRLRYFLFGIRTELLSDPEQQVSLDPYLRQCRVDQQVSVEQAIGDLPELGNGQTWPGEHGEHYEPDDNNYVTAMRRFLVNGDLFDHRTTLHQEYVIKRFELIPAGGNWESIREQMTTTYNTNTIDNTHRNIYRRLRREAPANTISHYRKSMVIHPWQHRGLSFREACRLQSFPDWFQFTGIRGAQQQQLANAVPPLMAASVAYAIAEFFLDETNRKSLDQH